MMNKTRSHFCPTLVSVLVMIYNDICACPCSPTSRSLKVYLQSVVDLRATEWGKKELDGRPKQVNPYLNMAVPTPLPDVSIDDIKRQSSISDDIKK